MILLNIIEAISAEVILTMEVTMFNEEFLQLSGIKNGTCITLTVATNKQYPEKREDPIKIKNALNKAEKMLIESVGKRNSEKLVSNLKNTAIGLDTIHETEGIGIFVTENFSTIIRFPFPVEEKIIINKKFHIRDIIYGRSSSFEFYFLLLSRKSTRLFRATLSSLTEIKDKDFPMTLVDDFEYAKPFLASSTGYALKGERDKSSIEDTRLLEFLHRVNNSAVKYLKNNSCLMLAGVDQMMNFFKEVKRQGYEIIGAIEGNFDRYNSKQIHDAVKAEAEKYLMTKKEKLISELDEKKGKNKAVSGLEKVWNAVIEGNADTLVVEKDMDKDAYVDEQSRKLSMTNRSDKLKHVNNAVEEVIEMVLQKKGNIVFVDNGTLVKHEGIALILRHN
jgi:hypothetical protein